MLGVSVCKTRPVLGDLSKALTEFRVRCILKSTRFAERAYGFCLERDALLDSIGSRNCL